MSLNAREQQALDSIKSGLAGSDPELAALLSAFTRLASGEEMPDREKVPARSRWALRRSLRGRRRSGVRSRWQRLGFLRAALLLSWVLTTAALIAVAVILSTGGGHGTCTETVAMVCSGPAPGHSPASPSRSATTSQAPQQEATGIPQAGP
jgi:hypothetical protein